MRPVLRTATGRDLFLDCPDAVCIEDIAAHLARINRFNGATREPYSVAQHSVWVAGAIGFYGGDAATQLAGLLHDAPEAYLGDLPTPVQRHIFGPCDGARASLPSPWESAHAVLAEAIHAMAGLTVTGEMRAVVKHMDTMALRTEWRDLMTGPEPANFAALPPPDGGHIRPFGNWQTACEVFLDRYRTLSAAAASEALK